MNEWTPSLALELTTRVAELEKRRNLRYLRTSAGAASRHVSTEGASRAKDHGKERQGASSKVSDERITLVARGITGPKHLLGLKVELNSAGTRSQIATTDRTLVHPRVTM